MTDGSPSTTWIEMERLALDLAEQALEVEAGERDPWLVQKSEGNEALLGRAREIVRLAEIPYEEAATLGPAAGAAIPTDAPTQSIDPEAPSIGPKLHSRGDRIDRYRIDREIGRGGMGVVYRATRADGAFEMDVALKLMQSAPGLDARRFEAERRILARLEHQNVARILDGGQAEDGSPYLVMELVDGESIVAYCERTGASFEDRVSLFLQVCDAVDHAHRNLVIHRDLKPANILVTDDGVPKLLDFGIAKLLEAEPGAEPLTRWGLGAMTPEYASPEQVRQEPVTVATDVYSLGVVLYELLTGKRPYRITSRSAKEIERAVCDTTPPPPSRAADRAQNPVAPSSRLRGDVDTVVMTALAKAPTDRYNSVDDFADDLRAVLDGRPIRARPHTAGYLLSRFVRRHKRRVAVACAVVALLLAALTYGFVQNLNAARQGRLALAEAQKLASTNEFLGSLFSAADPVWGEGSDVRVVDLLDVAIERLEDLEAPEARVTLRRTIGNTFFNLGLFEQAQDELQQAVDEAIEVYGEDHIETARARQGLALVFGDLGEREAALELLELVVPVFERDGSEDLHTAVAHYARTLDENGRWEEAKQTYERAIELGAALEEPTTDAVTTLNNYAVALMNQGLQDEAEPILRQALELHHQFPKAPEVQRASLLANLGNIAASRNDVENAAPAYRESIAISSRNLGDGHPDVLITRISLANLFWKVGRLDEASAITSDVLPRVSESLPEGHPLLGYVQVVHSGIEIDRGNGAAVEPIMRAVVVQRRAALPEGNWLISSAENLLAAAWMDQGRLDEAEALLRKALADLEGSVGPDHEKAMQARELLAEVQQRRQSS